MSDTNGRIGVAVVGLGVGEAHARAVASDPRCELRWLCDMDLARAKALQSQLGVGAAGRSLEEALADPGVGAVILATHDGDHPAQVVACLESGRDVFVEKPLCRTRADLLAIERAIAEHPRVLMVNLVLRASPAFLEASSRVKNGRLGAIYAFDGDYLYGRLEKLTQGWRGREPGYSVFAGGGVHLVDLMIGLVGEAPRAVRARGNAFASRGSPFAGPDFVSADYHFDSGLIARITANFGAVHRHHHAVRLFGTKGLFLCDDQGARYSWVRDPGGDTEPVTLPLSPSNKGALIPQFISAVMRSAPRDEATLDHELIVAAAIIAVDESLQRGDVVELPIPTPRRERASARGLYWAR